MKIFCLSPFNLLINRHFETYVRMCWTPIKVGLFYVAPTHSLSSHPWKPDWFQPGNNPKISHLIKPTSAKVRDILRMLLVDVGCCCSLHLKNLVQSGNCILFPTRTEKFLGFCSLWEVCVTQENRTKRFKNNSLYDEPYENTEDTLVLNTH